MQDVRVVEVLAALSLTTDLASGVPFEKGLRTCAVADEFADVLGVGPQLRRVAFEGALLRSIGCTAMAPESADLFVDDISFQAALKVLDAGDETVFAEQLSSFGSWAGADRVEELSQRFVDASATVGPYAGRAGCEVSRALGPHLGIAAETLAALDDVYERWDGLGIPDGRSGESISLGGRVVHVAEQAVVACMAHGPRAALAEVRRRAGGHLDPALVSAFLDAADRVLAPLRAPDALREVVARDPSSATTIPMIELPRLCGALAIIADLKTRYSLGHSSHVADVAAAAATVAGLSEGRVNLIRCAGLVHNIGAVVVPSAILEGTDRASAADVERIRLHTYWTQRILERCPAMNALVSLTIPAATHHQEFAASGYRTWSPYAPTDSLDAAIVAAAEVFASLTEPRPGRQPSTPAQAVPELRRVPNLDRDACAAVIEGAGLPRPPTEHPCGLTDREVDVLRLAARGLSNPQIAAELIISARTVGHHLSHIYDKTGLRTRAGVAVFAAENRLLPG